MIKYHITTHTCTQLFIMIRYMCIYIPRSHRYHLIMPLSQRVGYPDQEKQWKQWWVDGVVDDEWMMSG